MMKIKKYCKSFILTPGIYVSLVIGVLVGGSVGAVMGFFQGAAVGHDFLVLSNCSVTFLGYQLNNMHIILGGISGLIIGAVTIGSATGVVLSYGIFKNSNFSQPLTKDSIQPIIRHCVIISLVLNSSMVFFAICGGLVYPPLGSIVGAIIGFFLISFVYYIHSNMLFKPN